MNPDLDTDYDAILFPFPFNQLPGDLQREAGAYRHGDLNVWDLDDIEDAKRHNWGAAGRLIIYGHGSDAPEDSQYIYAGPHTTITPPDLAKVIKAINFPTGADNEIIVWSCHSGAVGRFAQLLTLYLTNEGYVGKKVWGCNRYGGTIDADHKCLKAANQVDARPQRATAADSSYYIGA